MLYVSKWHRWLCLHLEAVAPIVHKFPDDLPPVVMADGMPHGNDFPQEGSVASSTSGVGPAGFVWLCRLNATIMEVGVRRS